jgi:hypothetical protein
MKEKIKPLRLKGKPVEKILSTLYENEQNSQASKCQCGENLLYQDKGGSLFLIGSTGKIQTKIDGKVVTIDEGI